MIEENVAIICACLPMCRMVLTWLFPRAFAASPTKYGSDGPQYTIGSLPKRTSRSQSEEDDWQPYSGPGKAEGQNKSVIRHANDNTSEEFILQSVQQPSPNEMDGAIRKTTHYEISYEREHYNKV